MLMFFRPPSRNMSPARIVRRLVIHRGRLSALVAALIAAVGLTACGPSSPGDSPPPSGTQLTDLYTPSDQTTTDPYTPSDQTMTDPYTPSDQTTTDPYTPSDQTTTDPYTPSDETDPCAFPGDPLCPHTAVTIPPPDIGNWP